MHMFYKYILVEIVSYRLIIPLTDIAPYFGILLCLMPDNFTHQGERVLAQWLIRPHLYLSMDLVNPLSGIAAYFNLLFYSSCLTPGNFTTAVIVKGRVLALNGLPHKTIFYNTIQF
jgi:hypothetical protein